MYSFDGDFRRRPVVSLRGASKKEATASLLQRNQEERRKREAERNRLRSATKIQSFVRGSLCRHKLKRSHRREWDERVTAAARELVDVQTMSSLQRLLIHFYNSTEDMQRLNWLCQCLLKQRETSIRLLQQEHQTWLHQMMHILQMCCRLLEAPSSTPVPMPLRMLEVYTDLSTYQQYGITVEDAVRIVASLQMHLVQNGYYKSVRCFINERLPPGIDITRPPPIAQTALDLTLRPVHITATSPALRGQRNLVLCSLCQELLCRQSSEQISEFLIPALAHRKSGIQPEQLVEALVPTVSSGDMSLDSQGVQLGVEPSPWLLYAVMTIVGPYIDEFSPDLVIRYLLLLRALLPTLPSADRLHLMMMADDDSDMEEDLERDIGEFGNASTISEIREQCVRQVNSPAHVKCLIATTTQGNVPALTALCTLCHALMVDHKLHVPRSKLLYSLAINKAFIRHLWSTLRTVSSISVTGTHIPLLQTISRGIDLPTSDINRIIPLLSVFCSLFGHLLVSLHDSEFYGEDSDPNKTSLMPFSIEELVHMSLALGNACLGMVELAYPETTPSVTSEYSLAMASVGVRRRLDPKKAEKVMATWLYVFKVTTQLVKQLHARDIRRPFCPLNHWLAPNVHVYADQKSRGVRGHGGRMYRPRRLQLLAQPIPDDEEGPPPSTHMARRLVILAELPFVVPFEERVQVFREWVAADKQESQGDFAGFLPGKSIDIIVRRNYIYEDAYDRLRPENEPDLRKKLRVTLKNAQGLDEAGIDGGGISREFLSQLLRTAFDPNRGFFKTTTDELLYPSPQSAYLLEDFTKHYYFIGRMMGKILYENLLVEIPFASFFLSKILSRHSNVDIHHLASLDPVMYKNLLFLKHYKDDVTDLDLTFTVMDNEFGEAQVHELKPGGGEIPVTAANRIEYIHLMADFRLNKQIRPHILSFRQGLADVIDLEWLRMFDHQELQVLISGASMPIDVDDLRQHTNYSGGYKDDSPVIKNFWRVVTSMTNAQRRHLLKFVTSCSRPPLLGFKELYPAFCIHHGGSESGRLPTASTCMNLLKLPEFHDEKTLREKLLYAIESGAGFELS
ncbi:ubiquitin-protein ligase E3C-like [Diadema setosum]|uniref:ubiquitin-protein ligase E3C-like n=1 Tax=Diadema setosum TaxID=31175 RepID=UPI003B3A46D1